MKNRVIVRAMAEADIAHAMRWYDEQRSRLGHVFLLEVKSTLAQIAQNPLRYPRVRTRPEVRRALCARFPYRIFFMHRESDVMVFRVLHSARADREWKKNIQSD